MDQELKDKWVKALQSGDYDQTHTTLRDEEGFCCLGVLVDVANAGNWADYDFEPFGALKNDGYYCKVDIGLSKEDDRHLVHLNDDELLSFPEIADWIVENVEVSV